MNNTIKKIFLKRLGEPTSNVHLDKYISFCLEHVPNKNTYCEKHHILPNCKFNDYFNIDWNLVNLEYTAHIKAHKILAEAYTIKEFVSPLRFMLIDEDDLTSLLSKSQLLWFENLKKDEFAYLKWVNNISEKQKAVWLERRTNPELIKHWSEEQSRRSMFRHSKPSSSEKISKLFKDLWQIPEYRENISQKMKAKFLDEEYYNNFCAKQQEIWDNKTDEKRQNFTNIMSIVNADPIKRAKAGAKIKEHWRDPDFRERVMNSRKLTMLTEEHKNKKREASKKNWESLDFREKQYNSRKGLVWWNNGKEETKSIECPGICYVRGRTKKIKKEN